MASLARGPFLRLLATLSRGGSLIHMVVGGSIRSSSSCCCSAGGRRGGGRGGGCWRQGRLGGRRSVVVLGFFLVSESALDDLDLGATAGALNPLDVLVKGC